MDADPPAQGVKFARRNTFHRVSAKSVDALGALTHQEIAGSEHDAVRLLLFVAQRFPNAELAPLSCKRNIEMTPSAR